MCDKAALSGFAAPMCDKAVLSGFAAPMCDNCSQRLRRPDVRQLFSAASPPRCEARLCLAEKVFLHWGCAPRSTFGPKPWGQARTSGEAATVPAKTFCAKPCLDAAELRSLRIYIRLQLDSEGNFSYLIVVNNYFLFRRRHGHSATEATRVEP